MVSPSQLAQESATSNNNGASTSTKPSQASSNHLANLAARTGSAQESSGNQVGSGNLTDHSSSHSQCAADSGKNNETPTNSPAAKSTSQDMSSNANQPTIAAAAIASNDKDKQSKEAKTAKKGTKEKSTKKNKKHKNKKGVSNKGSEDCDGDDGCDKDTKTSHGVILKPDSNKPTAGVSPEPRQKSLVDELKLFQNNQLLNQQDPIQQLHIQLSQLTKGEEDENNNRHVTSNAVRQSMPAQQSNDNRHVSSIRKPATNDSLNEQRQSIVIDDGNQCQVATTQYGNEENIFTVKKGILWQQQQYDKFHQRLFNRWKKRYFILTTDYLVCFKRSTPKVGRSEMGKFLYKTGLSDVAKIERLKPKKSDKGAIILHINGEFNLFLWSKENLDEWMFMISESVERNRLRRSCQILCQNQNSNNNKSSAQAQASKQSQKLQDDIKADDLYENTANITRGERANSMVNHLLESEIDESFKTEISPGSNNLGDKDKISSSSLNDQETRSQTRYSRDEVHRKSEPTDQRGSQAKHNLKTCEIDSGEKQDETVSKIMEVDTGEVVASNSTSLSAAAEVISPSVSDNTKSSIERERLGDCIADLENVVQRDETRSNGIDTVQASGRVDDGTKVIYDPTDNDGSRMRTSNIGLAKMSNQTEHSGGSTDSSLRVSKTTQEKAGNRSSFKRLALKNQAPKESFSSLATSSSERVSGSRRSSKQSIESPRLEQDSSEQLNELRDRKRSADKQRIEKRSFPPNGDRSKDTTVSTSSSITTTGNDNEELNIEKIDKRCNSHPQRDRGDLPRGERLAIVCDPMLENTSAIATNSGIQPKPTTNLPASMTNRPLPTPITAPTNLVRRDDSWQSLVSLTCAGKATPVAMQVTQRSLYAQHIMPASGKADLVRYEQQQQEFANSPVGNGHKFNIESTITPCRGPFLRQQSVQSSLLGDRFRPLPPIGGVDSNGNRHLRQQQQHAASFDLATANAGSNSPMHPNQSNNQTTSYQQKLLQLQLLHNSNNVDYIRHNKNGGGDLSNDYQIYGPESTNGYGYGYSSMRSNLKSAASEFSFIRPTSSSQAQSTLPHPRHNNNQTSQPNGVPTVLASFVLNNRGTHQPPNQPIRSSLVLAGQSASYIQPSDSNNNDISNSSNCLSPMAKQFLVNPVTGERIINQLLLNGSENKPNHPMSVVAGEPMMAPMRELPLKPNKKRVFNGDGSAADGTNPPKSSSLTSSIACFFRRAFSRRSKKSAAKRRSKLAESCSSSLGAFEEGSYANAPMVATAFSTGSKSIDGVGRSGNSNNIKQSPRMIDMIEAFASKTHANETTDTLMSTRLAPVSKDVSSGVLHQSQNSNNLFKGTNFNNNEFAGTPKMLVNHQARNTLNQFGSPLHKSNSISATMGLSFALDQANASNNLNNNASSFLYDNAMMVASGGSPMLMRSNRVLSANLASLELSQQNPQRNNNEFPLNHQSFLSPRNSNRRSEHLPRPSSIYGQPSMISSPIISGDRGSGNFGIHRNSLHNQYHFRDRSQAPGLDVRRNHHQMMKVPFLDTTREVAEELSSPIAELSSSKLVDYVSAKDLNPTMNNIKPSNHHHSQMIEQSPSLHGQRYLISASPSNGKLNHRQAVVNPILQSPTMSTIYDNHPMLDASSSGGHPELSTSSSSYSHYDNHNHLLMGRQQQQNRHQIPASPSLHQHQQVNMGGLASSPKIHMANNFEDPYSQRINVTSLDQAQTPSHRRPLSSSSDLTPGSVALSRGYEQSKKPSAIVVPTSQAHNVQASQNHFRNDLIGSTILDHHNQNDRTNLRQTGPEPQSRSPMLSRRAGSQNHYQQSPLVSSHTRVLNKGDGVQATVSMGRPDSDMSGRPIVGGQQVINIAGAPGVNLEPSLAASLLRGTNINAYECSTFDRLSSGQSKQNSKTFLVSTRLSKSMAYSQGTSIENESDISIIRNENSNGTNCTRSSRDELSSSGSRSMTSSIGERSGSSQMRSSNLGTSSSHEDQEHDDSSSGSDATVDKSVIVANRNIQPRRASVNNNHRASKRTRKKESSCEQTGEVQSNSLEKPDERNWITSKLIQ